MALRGTSNDVGEQPAHGRRVRAVRYPRGLGPDSTVGRAFTRYAASVWRRRLIGGSLVVAGFGLSLLIGYGIDVLPGGTNPPPADIVDVPRWLWQVGLGFALIGSVVAGLAMYPSAGLRASGPTRGQDRHAAVVFGATIDAGFVLAWFAVPSSPYRSGTLGAATMTTVFACCTWIKDRGNE